MSYVTIEFPGRDLVPALIENTGGIDICMEVARRTDVPFEALVRQEGPTITAISYWDTRKPGEEVVVAYVFEYKPWRG